MRSFQVSADEDEDGGSPCRIFGSSEAIFIYLVLVGLSFGDNNIAVLRPGSRADICWFCFCDYSPMPSNPRPHKGVGLFREGDYH